MVPVRTLTKALRQDKRGATVVEFALIAAPFIALILATIQTAFVFFAQQCLEAATERTARQIMTGAVQKAGTSAADFKKAACVNLPAFIPCSGVMIDVRSAEQFDDLDTTTPTLTYDSKGQASNAWQFTPGGPGSIVVLRVMYLLPVSAAPLGFNLSNAGAGRRLLISTSVFKAEPYAS